jgi:hypothetical protein
VTLFVFIAFIPATIPSRHSDHDVIGQRVNGFVHDQYITRMYPGIDHRCSLHPDEEGDCLVLLVPVGNGFDYFFMVSPLINWDVQSQVSWKMWMSTMPV